MKQAEAERIVISRFREWCKKENLSNPNGTDGFRFYWYLFNKYPEALDFRCSGDKWQTVHGWLLDADLVSD